MKACFSQPDDARVCVIVPVYNGENTIARCLRSICRQTYGNIVVAAVDDGSTDGTWGIINKVARNDPRVVPIHQNNQGSVSARFRGVSFAKDSEIPYICFCDADDTLPSKSVEMLINAIVESKTDLVCGNMRKKWRCFPLPDSFKADCFKNADLSVYNRVEIRQQLINSFFGVSNFPVSLWAKLYKTSVLTGQINDEPIVRFYGDDLSITLRVVLDTDSLCIIPDTVYNYHIGGATGGYMPTMLEDFIKLYRFRQSVIDKYGLNTDCSDLMAAEAMNYLRTYFSRILEHKKELQKDRQRFLEIIEKTISEPLFRNAATMVTERGWNNRMAPLVNSGSADEIAEWIEKYNNSIRNSIKGRVRGILNKLA